VGVASTLVPVTQRLEISGGAEAGRDVAECFGSDGGDVRSVFDGRLIINIVTGWSTRKKAQRGRCILTHDERYEVTEEFLNVWKRVMAGEDGDVQGQGTSMWKGRRSSIFRFRSRIQRCIWRVVSGRD